MARGHAVMTDQNEVLTALHDIVAANRKFITWTVSTPHLVLLWEKAQELEREACAKVCESLEEQCEKLLVPDEKWPTPADCAHIIRARSSL